MNKATQLTNRQPIILLKLSALLLILFAALSTRVWPAYDHIFLDQSQIKLLGVDSFFHLRHAKYTVENYPEIQRLDIGASFPEPRPNEASGLFGLAISTIAISLFGKNASINDIAMTAAWGAPVLTVITYLLTFLLVRLLSNTSVALIAITFFLLYPGKTLDRGVLGFVDHHAAEYCLSLAIAIGLVTLMKPSGNKSTFHNWKIALYSVLPLILLIFTWQGAEIFLLIVCITILICWNFAVFRRDDVTLLTITNARYGIVLLLIITATTRNTLITQGASALILGAWIYTMIFKHYTQPRLAQHISVCVTVLAAAILFMLAYFTEVGRFLTSLVLAKSTNLIHEESEVNLALYLGQFGIVGVLAAIGMIVVPFSVLRSLLPLGAMVPIMFLAIWCALWWSSSDFGYYLPAFVSVCAALALYSLWLIAKPNAFGVNLSKNKHIKIGVFTLFAGVLALPVYPFQFVSSPWIDRHKLTAMTTYSEAWYESLAWFEENSPQPARTPLSSSKQKTNEQNQNIDDYGIMVAWDFGNIVASHGNRIPVWSSVPSAYTARWMLAQSEDESFEILSERQTDTKTIRYVIVDKDTYGPLINAKSKFTDSPIKAKKTGVLNVNGQFIPHIRLDETFQNSMVSRLYGNDGIELSHYRLVFESQHLTYSSGFLQRLEGSQTTNFEYIPKVFPINSAEDHMRYKKWVNADVVTLGNGFLYNGRISSSVKIFEIVEGTLIKGTAQPGDIIEARLALRSKTSKREFTYKRSITADENGHFRFNVPYSTDSELPEIDVVAQGPYQLWVQAAKSDEFKLHATLNVPEPTFRDRKLVTYPKLEFQR